MKKAQTSPNKNKKTDNDGAPLMVSTAAVSTAAAVGAAEPTRTSRTKAGSIERTNRFANIDNGLVPFNYAGSGYGNSSNIDVRDAVILCQKAYYNFAIFRNAMDLMTEFSCSPIHFRSGS